jgi:hypothetical protein
MELNSDEGEAQDLFRAADTKKEGVAAALISENERFRTGTLF